MIRFLTVLFSCCVFSACSFESECESRAISLADKFENQLFVDKAKDRHGFLNLAQKMQNDLGSHEGAFLLLKDKKLHEAEKQRVIREFGPLLLMMAISSADKNKITFYLDIGVDSLNYQRHVGVLVLDLLEVKDRDIFHEFKTFYEKNNLSSDVFQEVVGFYGDCVP
jgi:hypothetical protein